MKLTIDQILANSGISDEELTIDIRDTVKEISDFNDELTVLKRNPVDNKVKIYLTEGKLLKAEDLLESMKCIRDYRRTIFY